MYVQVLGFCGGLRLGVDVLCRDFFFCYTAVSSLSSLSENSTDAKAVQIFWGIQEGSMDRRRNGPA